MQSEAMQNPIRPTGKIRSPMAVICLSIITFGIYGIIWHYSLFEEMRNWRGQGWSGVTFLLFCLFLGIALIALPWLIPAYVGRMYAEDGKEKPISGLTGFWIFIPVIGGIVWIFKVQGKLNEFWETKAVFKTAAV